MKFKPNVENKYNLTVEDIKNFKLIDLEKLKTRCTRNEAMKAWCYMKEFGKGYYSSCDSSIWVGFYDEPVKGKNVGVICSCYDEMHNYIFNEFYKPEEIDNNLDLQSQEALLEFANWLIDEGVVRR